MRNIVHFCVRSATAMALLGLAACAGYDPYERDAIGVMSTQNYFQREVTITPDTKSVIAVQREVVKFTNAANGKSFIWNFDTRSFANFDLQRVAPDVMGDHHVIAYVYRENSPFGR